MGVVANKMDRALGTNYVERVEKYRKFLQKNDVGLTGAMTDVKGDRGIHPSKQIQHKDFYVRVVEWRQVGIIVRGAEVYSLGQRIGIFGKSGPPMVVTLQRSDPLY
jgi:4-hydroxybutyryl-CoA dehydratase/vinylacetyl-CoA-Delta-isomerase